jgi:hypothetical protein
MSLYVGRRSLVGLQIVFSAQIIDEGLEARFALLAVTRLNTIGGVGKKPPRHLFDRLAIAEGALANDAEARAFAL